MHRGWSNSTAGMAPEMLLYDRRQYLLQGKLVKGGKEARASDDMGLKHSYGEVLS